MRFISAKHFTIAHREAIDWIVIHATQGGERPGRALRSANRFAGIGEDAPQASAHYVVDPGEVIRCVRDSDVAWHCPGANRRGLGIEHCGLSEQTPEQWADADSEAELRLSADLVASLCLRWHIPAARLTPEQINRGDHGIAGHMDFTAAFATPGGHHDPGPDFPWQHYMEMVTRAIEATRARVS